MNTIEKGSYGYVEYRKKKQLFMTLAEFLAVSMVFLIGFLICKTKNNICTVIAIILVLPATRAFVAYLMFARLKTGDKSRYDELSKKASGYLLLSDCIMTCKDKNIYVPFAAVTDTVIYCYTEDVKFDRDYFEKNVAEFIRSCGDTVRVKLYTDYEQFQKKVLALKPVENKEKKTERIKDDFLILVI